VQRIATSFAIRVDDVAAILAAKTPVDTVVPRTLVLARLDESAEWDQSQIAAAQVQRVVVRSHEAQKLLNKITFSGDVEVMHASFTGTYAEGSGLAWAGAADSHRELSSGDTFVLMDDPSITSLTITSASTVILRNLPNLQAINSAVPRRYNFRNTSVEVLNVTNCGTSVPWIWVDARVPGLRWLSLAGSSTVTQLALEAQQLELAERAFAGLDMLQVNMKPEGGTISTVVGTGVPGFSGDGPSMSSLLNMPYGLGLDVFDNLLVADLANNRVLLMNGSIGAVRTLIGTG
jgi:hypothetical protein